eukprot:4330160-Pyramimonas_sp.AAC.1
MYFSPRMRRALDLQVCKDSSGRGTYSNVRKVCEMGGAPWDSFSKTPRATRPDLAVNWRLLVCCSGGGPDQAGWAGGAMAWDGKGEGRKEQELRMRIAEE